MKEETRAKLDNYINDLLQRLRSEPDNGLLRYNLACVLIGRRHYDQAEQELRKAVQLEPELAEAYVQLGGLAMRRGDMMSCLSFNKRAAEIRPRFAVPPGNIGFVYLQLGKVEEAIKYLKKAISLDPKFVQARNNLGNAYLMLGDPQGCIDECSRVVEDQPTFAPAYNNLMLAYLELGNMVQAEKYLGLAKQYGYEVSPEIERQIQGTGQ